MFELVGGSTKDISDLVFTSDDFRCEDCIAEHRSQCQDQLTALEKRRDVLRILELAPYLTGESEVGDGFLVWKPWVSAFTDYCSGVCQRSDPSKLSKQSLMDFFTTAPAAANDKRKKGDPPDEKINEGLLCEHGNLGQKKHYHLVSKVEWASIMDLYPQAVAVPHQPVCPLCKCNKKEAQQARKDDIARRKAHLEGSLDALMARKKPIPRELLGEARVVDDKVFHLVSRSWVDSWRDFIKGAGEQPGPIDSSVFKCKVRLLSTSHPSLSSRSSVRKRGLYDICRVRRHRQ